MDAIEYYRTVFGKELIRIQSATKATIKDRISIVSLRLGVKSALDSYWFSSRAKSRLDLTPYPE